MAKALAKEAEALEDRDPALAFEIAVLVEKIPGVSLAGAIERHVLAQPLALLPRLTDRVMRERALEIVVKERPADAPAILADWFFKEEDVRTLEAIDRRLAEIEPSTRERTLEKLLKSPRVGAARVRLVRAALRGRTIPSGPASTRRSSRAFSTRSPGTSWAPPVRRCGRCSTARVSSRAGS